MKDQQEQFREEAQREYPDGESCIKYRSGYVHGRSKSAEELSKLQAFKDYVHKRLDDAGIPIDPESPHKDKGCRIGGRLDIILNQLAELETLKKDNEWISVEDRLPNNAELCIVIAAGHHELAAYGLGYKCWIQEINNKDGEGDFTIRLDYVTHWRPLPQPPKQN